MEAIVVTILSSLLFWMVEGTIMCSTCRSDKNLDCETKAPPPQPCTESGSGVIESCSTIRIFKLDTTGELHQFIRSCSSSSSDKADCFDGPPGFRTCAQICYTDGCNSARHLDNITWLWYLVCLVTLERFL